MKQKPAPLGDDRIAYLEGLVRQGSTAAALFTQYTQQDVDRIVKAMVLAGLAASPISGAPGDRGNQAGGSRGQGHQEHGGHGIRIQLRPGQTERRRNSRISGTRPGGSRGTDRRDLFDHARHQSHIHRPVQMHHGHQDAQRRDFRTPSEGLAVLPGGRPDHVRGGGRSMALRKACSPASNRRPSPTTFT